MAANGQRGAAQASTHISATNSTDAPSPAIPIMVNCSSARVRCDASPIVVGRPALELRDHHGNAIVSRRIGQSSRLPGLAQDEPFGQPGGLFLKVAYWSRRLCGSTSVTTDRFNLSHQDFNALHHRSNPSAPCFAIDPVLLDPCPQICFGP